MNNKYIKNYLNVVALYFSKDRPMQLDLTLNSNHLNCSEWLELKEVVLYKATNERYKKAYQKLAKLHRKVKFIEETNFKKDVLSILQDKKYVLFVVDDSIFVNNYSLEDIIFYLEQDKTCLGFSLRLGKNTKICYPIKQPNNIPIFLNLNDKKKIQRFNWVYAGIGDFSYPLEVSSSIYPVSKLKEILENGIYHTPNSLESLMSINTTLFSRSYPTMLCYSTSKCFSNPINKVQTENNNRSGSDSDYQPEFLLKKFEKGYRINPLDFYGFIPTGCHEEVKFKFTNYTYSLLL